MVNEERTGELLFRSKLQRADQVVSLVGSGVLFMVSVYWTVAWHVAYGVTLMGPAIAAWHGVRVGRVFLYIGPGGVTVRNMDRTYRLHRAHVVGFESERAGSAFMLFAVLASGERVPIEATKAHVAQWSRSGRQVRELLRNLNSEWVGTDGTGAADVFEARHVSVLGAGPLSADRIFYRIPSLHRASRNELLIIGVLVGAIMWWIVWSGSPASLAVIGLLVLGTLFAFGGPFVEVTASQVTIGNRGGTRIFDRAEVARFEVEAMRRSRTRLVAVLESGERIPIEASELRGWPFRRGRTLAGDLLRCIEGTGPCDAFTHPDDRT